MSEYKVIKDCRHCDEANPAISKCMNPLNAIADSFSGHRLMFINPTSEACFLFRDAEKYKDLTPQLREIQITKDIVRARTTLPANNAIYIYSVTQPYDFIDLKDAIEETYFKKVEFLEEQS